MKPKYISLLFSMGEYDHEIWQALLSEWPFESFHDDDNRIIGYIQDHDITSGLMEFVSKNKGIYFEDFELEEVPDKNWNEVWESSFNPVAVDDYCLVMAPFHSIGEKKFRHIIVISPKMAFGTGHHATTYMMIQAIADLDMTDKNVFDFGCGTGLLSVLAAKEGARKVIGVDIQPEAIENSVEHAEMNGVEDVCSFYPGGIEMMAGETFDVILANINRNVILEHLDEMKNLLRENGFLLISGIMFDDVGVVQEALRERKMELLEKREKDQWVQLTLKSI